jgi:hypothetical protein
MLGASIYRSTSLSSWLTVDLCPCLHMRSPTCAIHLVYDASNREPFEAFRDWLEELENHVPPEVVKIVVGNKLYKVKSSPLLSSHYHHPFLRLLTRDTHGCAHLNAPDLGILSTSAHHQKCAAFAARTGCLFVEASAKMAMGVTKARSLRASSIRLRCGMRISPSRQEGRPPAPTPPPLVDRAVPQPRVCPGISICPRCRTRTRREGVCVSSAEVIF